MEVRLRVWEKSDLNDLVKYANNINIAKWLTNQFPRPYTRKDAEAYLQAIENNSLAKVFAIEADRKAVGSIAIFPQADVYEKSAEIGYWLAEDYWGQGIMTKAIREIVNYGFDTFDIIRIYARPFSLNKRSQKALGKAGFTLEATLKKALYKDNEFQDELIYSIIKNE